MKLPVRRDDRAIPRDREREIHAVVDGTAKGRRKVQGRGNHRGGRLQFERGRRRPLPSSRQSVFRNELGTIGMAPAAQLTSDLCGDLRELDDILLGSAIENLVQLGLERTVRVLRPFLQTGEGFRIEIADQQIGHGSEMIAPFTSDPGATPDAPTARPASRIPPSGARPSSSPSRR